jgi:hypothetical protein
MAAPADVENPVLQGRINLMTASPGGLVDDGRAEHFKPTSGRLVGFTSLGAVVALLLYLAVEVRTLTGLRVALGLVFVGVLVWATQLRSRAVARAGVLTLRNSFRDAVVPLALIDEVSVRRMLMVWVGGERFVCLGIGTPLRKMMRVKSRGPSSLLGWDRLEDYTEASTPLDPDRSEVRYETFVVTRIRDLAEEARDRAARGGTPQPRPRRTWAWPEIVALTLTGTAFVVSLLV